MLDAIYFPNLGLNFETVGTGFSLLGVNVSYYGIFMVIALFVGLSIVFLEAKTSGQHLEDYLELAIFVVPAAVIGARIYYVICSWASYKGAVGRIFALWEGGFGFYGGLLAALVVIVIFTRVRQIWTTEVLDTVAMGILAGQIIGNLGSFFNRECVGEYTDSLFAMQLPIDVMRVADVTDKMRNHMVKIGDLRFVQVHPVCFYQSFWCLLLFVVLYIYQRNKEFDGEVFWLFLMGDAMGRFWMDGLRTDSLRLPVLHWSASRTLAGILFVISVITIIYNRKMDGKGRMRRMRLKSRIMGEEQGENLL